LNFGWRAVRWQYQQSNKKQTNFLLMKSFKHIATPVVAAAGLATQADAIPITYSYTRRELYVWNGTRWIYQL